METRDAVMAILRYEASPALPIVHFGFWPETLDKWAAQGHISRDEARFCKLCREATVERALGFDFSWGRTFAPSYRLFPAFERKVLEEDADGNRKVRNVDGVIVMEKRHVVSIPTEVDHYFKGRREWEEDFRQRLLPDTRRLDLTFVPTGSRILRLDAEGWEYLRTPVGRERPLGMFAGSLIGFIRDFVGVQNLSYLTVDDPELLEEMVAHVGDLIFSMVSSLLAEGIRVDYLHFWEDICFKNGPLVNPRFFREVVGPQYRRITGLAAEYGIDIVSVDCDGMIDHLVPIWLDNGVNTMFPIEVGTWQASIAPWRERYGRALRGVGGMNKTIFARDRRAVEQEVERLKPLVALGGYIPCPDHLIAPDAKWDNVRYYCDLMRRNFG